jgi:hypothetical protein
MGAVDSFTLSTMPASDATRDIITDYELPAEMTATGEIVDGRPDQPSCDQLASAAPKVGDVGLRSIEPVVLNTSSSLLRGLLRGRSRRRRPGRAFVEILALVGFVNSSTH